MFLESPTLDGSFRQTYSSTNSLKCFECGDKNGIKWKQKAMLIKQINLNWATVNETEKDE